MRGQIIGNISDLYKVKYEDSYINCKARGKFRNQNIKPLVGDKVIFNIREKIITELLPRKNELVRPPICNVDQALIVMSVKEPNLDLYLLDKMISIISFNNIDIIICLTKLDLLSDNEQDTISEYISYYRGLGYNIINNNEVDRLKDLLKDKITVVTGQSGVGKSSLLNKLDSRLNLKTNTISHALGRGKHTTRHIELLEINDSFIADTPGFSSLDFYNMSREDIKNSIVEITNHSDKCRYRDCSHLKEEDCEIKKLVSNKIILESRYLNYQKFIQEKEEEHGKNIGFHSIKKQ
ncbi:MAG: ribosome small subunit-dependent GTPase A [Bacilli bacterium]|jgi:ribosome biogenesis GTPase